MRTNAAFDGEQVRAVYDGVQVQLYELFMGQQIHVGGYRSSIDLADTAGIAAGMTGVELCCGTGASMRLLIKLRAVASMTGVELAAAQVERGRAAAERDGVADRVLLIVGDATATELPAEGADFVWGEDAWCYVPDKQRLLAEAVRLTKPGGTIAFTDWVEGPAGLSDEEADHVMQAMNFPGFQTLDGYRSMLEGLGCDVQVAEDTGLFGPAFASYAYNISAQFAFDALTLFEFNTDLLALVVEELHGLSRLGDEGKLVQGRFVARTPA